MSLVVLVVHNPNLIKHSITYCELKSRPHNHKMTMTEFWISARRMTKTGFLEFYHIPSSYDFYDDIRKKSHKIKWKKIVHWLKNEFLSRHFFLKNKSPIIFPFTYFSGHNSSSIRVFSSRSNVTKKPWPVLRSHFSKITHFSMVYLFCLQRSKN